MTACPTTCPYSLILDDRKTGKLRTFVSLKKEQQQRTLDAGKPRRPLQTHQRWGIKLRWVRSTTQDKYVTFHFCISPSQSYQPQQPLTCHLLPVASVGHLPLCLQVSNQDNNGGKEKRRKFKMFENQSPTDFYND